ncbi:MAG: DUF2252 domain-containing protein [Acidobacteria bacterium]|nr:MAG: DUF2252 domain-containing protein [Acidobacteriota bacterium]
MKAKDRNGELVTGDDASQQASTSQRAARKENGKALRKDCPRSSHADAILGEAKRDPLALIEESNQGRVEKLLPIRYTRMAESAFAFFRGTALLQAHDLKGTPTAGITVQCCGDCHLMNFGGFATPERALIFDINDFDETHPGPFEWDVKRLAASFVLAARWLGFDDREARRLVQDLVAAYRTAQAKFAEMSVLETWYARITYEELLHEYANNPKYLRRMQKAVEKATQSTSEHVFQKITTTKDGTPRIVDQPPLLFHSHPDELHMERDALPFLKSYQSTLPMERQALLDRFQLVDTAYKVVGVGSVGTRCYIALFVGCQDDHLFLQVKEARPSVLQGCAGPSPYKNNGERVVIGQRLMQSASDIFLSWSRHHNGHDAYVRQLRDMKVAPDLVGYTPDMLTAYGDLCGKTLARAHAKSGDAAMIAGYLGNGSAFDNAIAQYALAYADQVEKDYDSFKAATRSGRFPVTTTPSELEQAIR